MAGADAKGRIGMAVTDAVHYDLWLHAIAAEGIIDLAALAAEIRSHLANMPAEKPPVFANRSRVPAPGAEMLETLQGFIGEVMLNTMRHDNAWHVSLIQLVEPAVYQSNNDTTYFNAAENGQYIIRHALGRNWRPIPETVKQGLVGQPASALFAMSGISSSGMIITEIIENDDNGAQRHQRIIMTRSPINTEISY